jgi:hypothetical protein
MLPEIKKNVLAIVVTGFVVQAAQWQPKMEQK